MTWWGIALAVAGGLALLYLVGLLLATYFSLHPFRIPQFISPGLMGLPQETVTFQSEDGTHLRGWWVEGAEDLVVVFCHGYLMNRCEYVPIVAAMPPDHPSCLLFDFRAHGTSGGRQSSFGHLEREDVAAACRFARARRPRAKIALFGSSMGGAASALALGDDPTLADALILDHTYGRLDEAGHGWWVFLAGKVAGLLMRPTLGLGRIWADYRPRDVDIVRALANVDVPMLIFAGTSDPIVPAQTAQRLADAAGPGTRIVWFEGGSHVDGRFREPQRYLAEVMGFLHALRSVEGPDESDGTNPATDSPGNSV